MIIDANDLILGRIAAFAAKQALLGEKIDIINCENIHVTGKKNVIIDAFLRKWGMGIPSKGPYLHRTPEKIVKRAIRGMLPYKKEKGKRAFKNIKCHNGVPEELKDKETQTVESAKITKLPNLRYMKIGELVKILRNK